MTYRRFLVEKGTPRLGAHLQEKKPRETPKELLQPEGRVHSKSRRVPGWNLKKKEKKQKKKPSKKGGGLGLGGGLVCGGGVLVGGSFP